MTSIRYEYARGGPEVVEMGLTGKPEFQQGKAGLRRSRPPANMCFLQSCFPQKAVLWVCIKVHWT